MNHYSRLSETPLVAGILLTLCIFFLGYICSWMVSRIKEKNKDVRTGLMSVCFFLPALAFAYGLYAAGFETGIQNGKVIGRDEIRNARELLPSTKPTTSPYPDQFGGAPES